MISQSMFRKRRRRREVRTTYRRYPGSNSTLAGRAFEVTPDRDIVWEYLVPYLNEEDRRATIMRLYRYESEFVEGLPGAARW